MTDRRREEEKEGKLREATLKLELESFFQPIESQQIHKDEI